MFNQDLPKIIVALLFFALVRYLRLPQRTRFYKLSHLRKYRIKQIAQYGLTSKGRLILSWTYIIFYIIIFFIGFFWLRFKNRNNIIDLREIFFNLYAIILNLSWLQIVINCILFMSMMLFVIVVLNKLKNYFYFQVIRQHIFFSDKSWYEKIFYYIKFNIIGRISIKIYDFITNCFYYCANGKWVMDNDLESYDRLEQFCKQHERLYYSIHGIRRFLDSNCHMLVLFLALLYDVVVCNLLISNAFKVLPYVFLYSIYCNIERFISTKNFEFDLTINAVLVDGRVEVYQDWLPKFRDYAFEIKL